MSRSWRRLRSSLAVVTAVLVVATLGLADPARAVPQLLPPPPVLSMDLTHTGFEVPGPNPRPAGPVTFRASTADPGGHLVSIFSLQPGVTLDTAIQEFLGSASPDPAVSLPATRNLFRDVIFRGGLKVLPGVTGSFTVSLEPDTYYVVESPIGWVPGRPPYVLRALEVTGPAEVAQLPWPDSAVGIVRLGEDERFLAPATMSRTADVLVTNLSPDPHELIIDSVAPGTTTADLAAYFAAEPGSQPPDPLRGSRTGLLNLSPGRWAIFHLDLPAGPYAMLSFIRDPMTGTSSTATGMARTVTLS